MGYYVAARNDEMFDLLNLDRMGRYHVKRSKSEEKQIQNYSFISSI